MSTLADLVVGLGIDASDYTSGLSDVTAQSESFGSRLAGVLGGALKIGLAATAGVVAASIGAIFSGVSSNAEFERYATQFEVLLGSADAAEERLAALSKFGASTPFELPEVVKADKILQGFGLHSEEAAKQFGHSGAQILTIAGDVASGTGASFEEMSLLLGKFSAGATGEAIARMAELGIASKADLTKMGLEFSKSGQLLSPLPEAMTVVLALMEDKYGGMMDKQSRTFEGMVSNLMDWKDQTIRAISAPIFEVLKDKLGALLAYLGDPATQAMLASFADNVALWVGQAVDFVANTAIPAMIAAWERLQPVFATIGAIVNTIVLPAFVTLVDIVLQQVVPAIGQISAFISANAQPILAGLAAVLVGVVIPAIWAWATATTLAAATTVIAMAPVILPLLALGVAVAVLYKAWSENWGGIQDKVGAAITFLTPYFNQVIDWLQINIPIAIAAAQTWIVGTLIPALVQVWAYIDANVLPILATVVTWLQTNVPAAITVLIGFWNGILYPALVLVRDYIANTIIPTLMTIATVTMTILNIAVQGVADYWNNTLLPAFTTVRDFAETFVIPLLFALANVYLALVSKATEVLGALWNNVLQPALAAVADYISKTVGPVITNFTDKILTFLLEKSQAIADFWNNTLQPTFTSIANTLTMTVAPALAGFNSTLHAAKGWLGDISTAVQGAIGWLNDFASTINSIQVPDWLQGHSPPPMADWFSYIGDASKAATGDLDTFSARFGAIRTDAQQLGASLRDFEGASIPIDGMQPRTYANTHENDKQQASDSETGHGITLIANYVHQPEASVRDDVTMLQMMQKLRP